MKIVLLSLGMFAFLTLITSVTQSATNLDKLKTNYIPSAVQSSETDVDVIGDKVRDHSVLVINTKIYDILNDPSFSDKMKIIKVAELAEEAISAASHRRSMLNQAIHRYNQMIERKERMIGDSNL